MWMDLENIMLSDIRQRKTNITYKCNLKIHTNEDISTEKCNHRFIKQTFGYQRGKVGEE